MTDFWETIDLKRNSSLIEYTQPPPARGPKYQRSYTNIDENKSLIDDMQLSKMTTRDNGLYYCDECSEEASTDCVCQPAIVGEARLRIFMAWNRP